MHSYSELHDSDGNKSNSRIVSFFKLFSRSTPLMIAYFLRRRKKTLSEISRSLRMTQKSILPELSSLQSNDIVVSFNRSQKTFYRLADDGILQALDLIQKVSQRKVIQAEAKNLVCKNSRISRRDRI